MIMISSRRRHSAATPSSTWPPRSAVGSTSVTSTGTRCGTITERRWRFGWQLKWASPDSCTPPRWSSTAKVGTAAPNTALFVRRRAGGTILRLGVSTPLCPICSARLSPELVPESAALDPRSVYAATKAHGEQLAAIWSRETAGTVVVTGEYRLGDVRHVTADCSLPSMCSAGAPRLISPAGSPACQRLWSPDALTNRLRDEDELSPAVACLDDLVRLRGSVEGEGLELDH